MKLFLKLYLILIAFTGSISFSNAQTWVVDLTDGFTIQSEISQSSMFVSISSSPNFPFGQTKLAKCYNCLSVTVQDANFFSQGTKYYISLAGSSSNYWEKYTTPLNPVITSGNSGDCNSVNYTWTNNNPHNEYFFEIHDNNTYSSLITSGVINGTSATINNLESGTTYYFRLRARTPDTGYPPLSQSEWTNASAVTTIGLSTPSGLYVTNIGSTVFTANWSSNPSLCDDYYHIRIYNENNVYITGRTAHTNSLRITGLSCGKYKFKVRAVGYDGKLGNYSAFSSVFPLRPAKPTGVYASNGNPTSFRINWNMACGATSYNINVRKRVGFGTLPGYPKTNITQSPHIVMLGDECSNGLTLYDYSVTSVNESGPNGTGWLAAWIDCSDPSSAQHIDTDLQQEYPGISSMVSDVIIYPNPSKNFIYLQPVSFEGDANALLNYTIFNVMGKPVKSGQFRTGDYVDLEDLPAGSYFIKMDTENFSGSKKIYKK